MKIKIDKNIWSIDLTKQENDTYIKMVLYSTVYIGSYEFKLPFKDIPTFKDTKELKEFLLLYLNDSRFVSSYFANANKELI